jgi:hypothetical protein
MRAHPPAGGVLHHLGKAGSLDFTGFLHVTPECDCTQYYCIKCNCMHQSTITPHQALKRMRELTALGIPFSFEFDSYNSTKRSYGGRKAVAKGVLRLGLRNDQSSKAGTLIAYQDHSEGDVPRFFHMALLMKFNNYTIKP